LLLFIRGPRLVPASAAQRPGQKGWWWRA